MGKRMLFLLCLFIVVAIAGFCDTITLKSGKQIEGTIKEKTNDAVRLDIEGITITYYISDIDSINGEQATVDVVSPQPVVEVLDSTTASVQDTTNDISQNQQEMNPVATMETPLDINRNSDEFTVRSQLESSAVRENETILNRNDYKTGNALNAQQTRMVAALTGGLFLFILILSLVFYVYTSLCLYFIAQKTQTEPAWLAWIPIANLFLMCKIAKISYLWLLGVIGLFIPFINILANFYFIGLSVFMWYKIALARGRPAWLGILTIVPIANFVIMGYLAFSE